VKSKLMICLFVGLAFSLTLAITARQSGFVGLIGVITVPGGLGPNGVDLLFVDHDRGRLYVTDRTNNGVDIIDAVNDVWVDRVPGFVGLTGAGGLRGGPNGVLVTPDNFLWGADGNSLVQVADLNVLPPRISHTISIGAPTEGRADELAYDPFERIILVGSDVARPPRVTFISADTYSVIGKIDFPDATGMEEPVWDTQLHRFLINVPSNPSYVAVIDPRKKNVTKRYIIPGCSGGVNGMELGPSQRMLVSACGNAYIMNAIDGHIIVNVFPQVAGGDQVNYNPGDNRYYVTAADRTAGLGNVLGVIDAATNSWIQNVPAIGPRNLAAYAGNNHIFTAVVSPAATAADTTVCKQFGFDHTGCVAVFSHN
jgi:hypothetical protein